MKRLLHILVVDSIRELIRYKSFFLLVGLLIVLDRVLKHYSSNFESQFNQDSFQNLEWTAVWIYETLPFEILDLMLIWKLLAVDFWIVLFQTIDYDVALKRYAHDTSPVKEGNSEYLILWASLMDPKYLGMRLLSPR